MTELIAVLSPVVSGLGVLLVFLVDRRNARSQETTSEADAEATAAETWRKLYSEMAARVQKLEERLSQAEARFTASETRERRLARELDAVFAWIEAGMEPPPPARPDWLKGV